MVAVGGDGTVNEVDNGLAGKENIFAVNPAGTGNDFAHVINMAKNIEEACLQIIRGKTKMAAQY